MTPDEITGLSDSKLLEIVKLWNKLGPDYDLAVKEYCRRQEIKEKENKTQMSTSIRWSKIAGIAALVGIALMIVQILLSIYEYKPSKGYDAPQVQLPGQSIRQPTKSPENLSSSSSNSSKITPAKKSK